MTSQSKERQASSSEPVKGAAEGTNSEAATVVQHKHVAQNAAAPETDLPSTLPTENGGQAGLDPTRYGDWEKKGRCTDF